MNAILGRPGIAARSSSAPAATASGRARVSSCDATSSPRGDSDAARVVMRPPDIDTSSAGIAVTRPSPTVRMVNVWAASASGMPRCSTPMIRPATMLTAVMRIAAIASRWVKRMAPSMAP